MNDEENTPDQQTIAMLRRLEFQLARSSEIVEAQQARIDSTLQDLRALRTQSKELQALADQLTRGGHA